MDQRIVSILFFKALLRKTFCKAIAAIGSGFCGVSGQSQKKAFWKGFTILDATKSMCGLWEEVTISTIRGVWEKLISTLLYDSEGFKPSVEEGTANVLETARELEFKVEPEDVTELLQSHDKTWMNEELLLMDK